MADARRLAELGFATPLARELAQQIEAGVGDARRLTELGMVSILAFWVASFIAGGVNIVTLVGLGMVPEQAKELKNQIDSGGTPPNALTSPIDNRILLSPVNGRILLRAA